MRRCFRGKKFPVLKSKPQSGAHGTGRGTYPHCFLARIHVQRQPGKTEPSLGKRVGPQATPTSPQISPGQPGPAPVCGSREMEGVGHSITSGSCPTYRAAFPSFVRRAFTRTSLEPHCARLPEVLPCLVDSSQNEANGPSGADIQHASLLPQQGSVRGAPGWPSPAMSNVKLGPSHVTAMGFVVCPPMTVMRGGPRNQPFSPDGLCSPCVSVHMPIGPTRRTSSSVRNLSSSRQHGLAGWSGALVDCRSMPLGLSFSPMLHCVSHIIPSKRCVYKVMPPASTHPLASQPLGSRQVGWTGLLQHLLNSR